MSFSGSISNALSGMRASSLAAELISSNLANSTNEAYAPRSLSTSSRVVGGSGGVSIDGVVRNSDKVLLAEWRGSNSELAHRSTMTTYLSRIETSFGSPDSSTSLTAKLADFEAALISASSRPDLTNRLETVAMEAGELVDTFGEIANKIQTTRAQADAQIAEAVEGLNSKLEQLKDINVRIVSGNASGNSVASLEDLQRAALDDISEYLPIRLIENEHGSISVLSTSGVFLLDGTTRPLEFDATPTITEHQSFADGHLSGLSQGGAALDVSRLGDGKISALFELRDDTLPEFQAELDAVARNLVERYQGSGVDSTIGASDPALFTDSGGFFDASDEVGLSQRLSLNALVDLEASGEVWRLRDGLGASSAGPVGSSELLTALQGALTGQTSVLSGKFAGQTNTLSQLSSNLLSSVGTALTSSEDAQSYAAARSAEVTERKFQDGVDSDSELQRLLQVEKAYAANAKVLQVVDEMLDVLMGI